MIRVVAILTAKPGRREELLKIFHANIPAVHAEDGCVEYATFVDAEGTRAPIGPDAFAVLETWASLAALDAHRTAPHMVSFGSASKDLVADRKVHVFASA
jgi:quinol monooxygenase YgiN